MSQINKDLIESIRVFKKAERKGGAICVVPPSIIKRWFRPNIEHPKRVKVDFWHAEYYTFEEFEKEYGNELYVEDDKVFYHPHVDIKMPSGQNHTKRFKTVEELEDWIKANIDVSLIEIKNK